ncbi:MAG: TRAP transporter substrate-binding protein [Alphaproteobacteria bacterium]|nr:TRAP transporter substrate-binding protein [Alphaproteobacteria bacterium]
MAKIETIPGAGNKGAAAKTGNSRRRFLTGGAAAVAAGAATLAMPSVSRAQTVTWRFQSTWGATDIFHEYAQDYVKRVNEIAGNRFKLELLAANAVVGAFQTMDATHSGALDGSHGVTAYWYGKHKAASFYGTTAPFGWDANQLLGWFYYGGGMALYNELIGTNLKLNVVGYLTGPMPTQPLGWFKKDIRTGDDLKGLKFRTVGLAGDLYTAMGLAVTNIPGGEVVPSMQRGVLDAAEFNNPSSDRAYGMPDVSKSYVLGSYHQRMETFEVLFNKTKHDALPAELKATLRYAAEAASADMSWKQQDRYPKDLQEMRDKQGVKTSRVTDAVLQAQLAGWTKVLAELEKDPYNKKVLDSQRAWVKRVVGFYREYDTSNEMAWNYFNRA